MASSLTVAGTKIGGSGATFSLSFVVYAVMKYLAYHVANYGHSLERDQDAANHRDQLICRLKCRFMELNVMVYELIVQSQL